jgi:hypothetical protein
VEKLDKGGEDHEDIEELKGIKIFGLLEAHK